MDDKRTTSIVQRCFDNCSVQKEGKLSGYFATLNCGDNSGINPPENITDHCRGDSPRKPMWISSLALHDIHIATTTCLYVGFIDLSKSSDTVDSSTLIRIHGCPQNQVKIIQECHGGMAGEVCIGGSITEPFEISHGLYQGYVLFTLFLAALLSTVAEHLNEGVFIRTRSGGNLFQLARLKASKQTREHSIRELLFADEAAVVAHTL